MNGSDTTVIKTNTSSATSVLTAAPSLEVPSLSADTIAQDRDYPIVIGSVNTEVRTLSGKISE